MFFGSGTTRCFAFPRTLGEIHNLVARLVIEVLCDSASLASIRDNKVRHKRNFMQYPTVNRDNSKQGSSKLLSVIGFCAVSLLQPVFTVSHAIDTDTPLLRHDSDGDGAPIRLILTMITMEFRIGSKLQPMVQISTAIVMACPTELTWTAITMAFSIGWNLEPLRRLISPR